MRCLKLAEKHFKFILPKGKNTGYRQKSFAVEVQKSVTNISHQKCSNLFSTSRSNSVKRHFDNSHIPLASSSFTLDELRSETDRLLQSLPISSSDDRYLNLAKLSKNEFDNVMEAWSQFYEKKIDQDHQIFNKIQSNEKQNDSSHHRMYAAEQAEMLLQSLENNYDRLYNLNSNNDKFNRISTKGKALIPTAISYNYVIHAYATSSGGVEAADKAQAILERMLCRCRDYLETNSGKNKCYFPLPPPPPEPTSVTFNSVLNAQAKSQETDAGHRAEAVFSIMERWSYIVQQQKEQWSQLGYIGVASPNVRSLCTVIDSWSNNKEKVASDRAIAMLESILERTNRENGTQDHCDNYKFSSTKDLDSKLAGLKRVTNICIQPNIILFNSVLKTLSKSNEGCSAAEKAENVLVTLNNLADSLALGGKDEIDDDDDDDDDDNNKSFSPNTRTLTLVMECWTNSVNSTDSEEEKDFAAKKAEAVLCKMITLYKQGNNVKPNFFSFTSCITALSKCQNVRSAERGESILNMMLDLYSETKDEDFKPSTVTFNTCLSAHARSDHPQSVKRAESLLAKLELYGRSDIISYNTLMNAYSKGKGGVDASNKAMVLLEKMKKEGPKPDRITYNSILGSLVKSNETAAIEKANSILEHMIQSFQVTNSTTKACVTSFTTTLNVYAKSSEASKVEGAHIIYQKLFELHKSFDDAALIPDVNFFTAFLNVCANEYGTPNQRRMGLRLALQAFEDLKQTVSYGLPNQFTYGLLMKACRRLAKDERERTRLLENVFKQCSRAGMVSNTNLNHFLQGASHSVKKRHFVDCTGGGIGKNERYLIPVSWCYKVRRIDRPLTKL